jgi:hypothetical protein
LAVSASAGFACDQHAEAAEAAEAKDAKAVVAHADAKGCDMPCCAHAKGASDVKTAVAATDEKPCASHDPKGCPKKTGATAAAVAKPEPAKDAAKAEPAADPGTHR